MRPTLSLLAALILLAGGLTGCLGGEEEPTPQSAGPDASSGEPMGEEALANVTDDGTDEAKGASLGHMPHIHDYWKGKERVTLMDEDVTVDAFGALGFTFFNTFRGTPGAGGAFVELPDGQIVFEGTGQLEFTASWTDPTVTGMAVRYRTPASADFGEPHVLQPGAPLVVAVTPEMTDMPHAKTSRWHFLVGPGGTGQAVVGTFHVRVEIVKMRDIGLFPGHPELFNGANTLQVFDGSGSSSQANFATMIANALTGADTDDGVLAQKVVPMETRSMTANLTIKSASTDLGTVADIYLLVKPADRTGYLVAEVVEADPETNLYKFAWLVDMRQTDSPYAEASDWKFDVWIQSDPSGGALESSCGGCSNAKVDYDLVVVAYDDVLDEASELRGGRGRG